MLTTFRRTPTTNAEGQIQSEGSVGKFSVRRIFRYVQICTGPRRSPSACAEILKKKARSAVANCTHDLQMSRLVGSAETPVRGIANESIVGRVVALLRHLDRQHPELRWGQYLAPNRP